MKLVLFLSSFFVFIAKVHAYPTYVRLNYTSCLACHQSVEGGGPLTQYGKGIAYAESFVGGEYKTVPGPTWYNLNNRMEHSVQARMMALQRLSHFEGKKTDIFPMQLDYSNVVKWQKDLRQEVTFAIAPSTAKQRGLDTDTTKKPSVTDRIYLRTYKLDYSIDKNSRVVVGGANLPMGLGLSDHSVYVRSRNRLGVTDVPIQAQYLSLSKEWQQTYLIYTPSPTDGVSNREYGVATKQEYNPITNLSLGAQGLVAKGKSIDREMLGIFSRFGKGPFAVLAEMDYVKRHLATSEIKFDQWTTMLQGNYFFKEYLRSSLGFHVLRVNNPFKEKEELYIFNNELKLSANWALTLEYRQKYTDLLLEKMVFGQIFLNWW